MKTFKFLSALTVFLYSLSVYAADVTGTWTASFDTQIGKQNYTYDFKVDGMNLTGTITTANGEAALTEGMVHGNEVMFTETLKYQGQDLKITYKGNIVSDDEISFTRNVAGLADEKLTATRSK